MSSFDYDQVKTATGNASNLTEELATELIAMWHNKSSGLVSVAAMKRSLYEKLTTLTYDSITVFYWKIELKKWKAEKTQEEIADLTKQTKAA